MKYHCKIKSVLLLLTNHEKRKKDEKQFGEDLHPISYNSNIIHQRTNSINSRRIAILEELGVIYIYIY